MQEQFGIGPEQVDTLYQYAKSVYEGGNYKAAGELLHQYTTYSLDPLKLLSAMWGKLASEILDCNVRELLTSPRCRLIGSLRLLCTVCVLSTLYRSVRVS